MIKRDAFTMIEIIFIIVVIGILAVTAVPKLMATRDDARMTTVLQNLMIGATDIAGYTVARGQTEALFSDMSAAIKSLVETGYANDTGNYQTNIIWGGINDCVILKVDTPNANAETLIIEFGNSTNDKCDRLRSMVDMQRFPMPLHGAYISF